MWRLLSSILFTDPSPTHRDTCLLHPQSLGTRVGTPATHKPPMRYETLFSRHCSHSANSGAWRIVIIMCVLPQLAYTANGDSPIQLFLTEWALHDGGVEEGQVSAPTIPNTISTMCIALWMQCRLLKLVKKMVLLPVLLTLEHPKYLHLRFVLFHCKQDFSQWYWWPGKKEIRREKEK